MMEDIYQTQNEVDAAVEQKAKADGFLRDLADVVSQSTGFNVLLEILRQLGVEGLSAEDPRLVAMRNVGEQLLLNIQAVRPNQALRLIAALRGIIL